jgi:hypothetical protein
VPRCAGGPAAAAAAATAQADHWQGGQLPAACQRNTLSPPTRLSFKLEVERLPGGTYWLQVYYSGLLLQCQEAAQYAELVRPLTGQQPQPIGKCVPQDIMPWATYPLVNRGEDELGRMVPFSVLAAPPPPPRPPSPPPPPPGRPQAPPDAPQAPLPPEYLPLEPTAPPPPLLAAEAAKAAAAAPAIAPAVAAGMAVAGLVVLVVFGLVVKVRLWLRGG